MKASQRRSLTQPRNPGGIRPKRKPKTFRDEQAVDQGHIGEVDAALFEPDAALARAEELAALIAEQEKDLRFGDTVPGGLSLDAQIGGAGGFGTVGAAIGVDWLTGEILPHSRAERKHVPMVSNYKRYNKFARIPIEFRWWRKGRQKVVWANDMPRSAVHCHSRLRIRQGDAGPYCTHLAKYYDGGVGYCWKHGPQGRWGQVAERLKASGC